VGRRLCQLQLPKDGQLDRVQDERKHDRGGEHAKHDCDRQRRPRSTIPIRTLASVNLPIRQLFGWAEGRTLSVVDDIARKSPVIIEITIRMA
jgi:hypothetical protein